MPLDKHKIAISSHFNRNIQVGVHYVLFDGNNDSQDIIVEVNGYVTKYHIYASRDIAEDILIPFLEQMEKQFLVSNNKPKILESAAEGLNLECVTEKYPVYVIEVVRGFNFVAAQMPHELPLTTSKYRVPMDMVMPNGMRSKRILQFIVTTIGPLPGVNLVEEMKRAYINYPTAFDLTSYIRCQFESGKIFQNLCSVIRPANYLEIYEEKTTIENEEITVTYGKLMHSMSSDSIVHEYIVPKADQVIVVT